MKRDHFRENMRDGSLHVFGELNRAAVEVVRGSRDISIENIDRVSRRLGANRDAVAAYFGWLRAARGPGLYVHMWRPAGPIEGVLDRGDVQVFAGWCLCRLLTVRRRRWPRECARPLLVHNDTPKSDKRYREALRGWEPGRRSRRLAARH